MARRSSRKKRCRSRKYKTSRKRSRKRKPRRRFRTNLAKEGYKQLSVGSTDRLKKAEAADEFSGTYGEILEQGAANLMRDIGDNARGKVFYDLGCGQGKVLSLMSKGSQFRKVKGVELCPNRVKEAREKTRADPKIEVFEESLLHPKFFRDADVIYLSNLCFSRKMQDSIAWLALSPTAKRPLTIFASQKLDLQGAETTELTIPMTWRDSHRMTKYVLS